MEHSVSYVGTYKNDFGTVDIIIHNDFKKFSLKIEEVEFEGSEFNALEIINKHLYSVQQLERFTLSRIRIYGTDNFVEELCNCTFNVNIPQLIIPQLIISSKTQGEFVVNMNVEYVLGDERSLSIGVGLEFEKNICQLKLLMNHLKAKRVFLNLSLRTFRVSSMAGIF